MSDRYRYCSSGAPSGTLTGPNWACGTRRYWAWPPGTDPYSEVYPNRAAPLPWLRTWVVSHWANSPRSHIQQCPQEMLNGITTRSPARRWVMSAPVASTIPIGSCPSTSPGLRNGPRTPYRCRSEPQIAVEVTRMTMSFGSWITGSGTSVTSTCSFPCHVSARMRSLSLRLGHRGVRRGPGLVRQQLRGGRLNLVLRRSRDHLALAGHQGLEPVPGHVGRVVLACRAGGRPLHACPLEELGVGRSRQQGGHGDAGVLQLVAQCLREGLDEGLRGGVGGVVRTGHLAGHRRGEQHPARAACHHVRQDPLGQVHRGADVQGD